jgi:hypothetical protein
MANTIRIKRRAATGAAGSPASLKNGELAYNENDNILYYGYGDGGSGNATTIPAIAGSGAYATLGTAQTIAGNKTFTGSVDLSGATVTVPTKLQSDNSTNAASTAYVRTAISAVTYPDATNSVKGIASFDSGSFSVTSGAVSIKTSVSLTTPNIGAATGTSLTGSSDNITLAAASGNNNVVLQPTGTGVVNASSKRITNVATPVLLTDAVNKAYADGIASSLNIHGSVQAATNSAVSYTYVSGGTALTINAISSSIITFSGNHGLQINSQIKANASSNGLTSGTTYYVISTPDLNQVTISTTPGGTTHTLTGGSSLNISVTGDEGVGATLTGTPTTLDSYSLVLGDSVLVKDHTTAAYNGVYTVTTLGTGSNGVWTRRVDSDNSPTGELQPGDFYFVAKGTTNANSSWTQTTLGPIIVGTTSIAFTQFAGAGTLTAGDGLVQNGSAFDAVGTSNRITVNANSIDIASTYVGQSSITTLGTIGTGAWNGSVIGSTYGGTGINNGSYTITLGGNISTAGAFTTSGAYGVTLTATALTSVTLPTSGTLLSDASTIDAGTF